MRLLRIPAVFYVDHMERALPTPKEHKGNAKHVWIDLDDPATSSLLNDAQFYAAPFGPDNCPRGIIASAKATVKAITRATDNPSAHTESTPRKTSMSEVIDLLLKSGFVPDGTTETQIVRIPTKRSPLYGKSGGELATMGGRQRFMKPQTKIKATVGKRTTAIYRVGTEGSHNGVQGIATMNTANAVSKLPGILENLS